VIRAAVVRGFYHEAGGRYVTPPAEVTVDQREYSQLLRAGIISGAVGVVVAEPEPKPEQPKRRRRG
jgi:hypothetical protein